MMAMTITTGKINPTYVKRNMFISMTVIIGVAFAGSVRGTKPGQARFLNPQHRLPKSRASMQTPGLQAVGDVGPGLDLVRAL